MFPSSPDGRSELAHALAQAHFYRTVPDKTLAEKYAIEALALVRTGTTSKSVLLPAIRK